MSRFDQPTQEPDYDRYDAKPLDPDDEPPDDPPVGPVEHDAHAVMSRLHALESLVIGAKDLERAIFLKKIVKHLAGIADRIDLKASAKMDEMLERRR